MTSPVPRTIALYTTETMADWEYAYLTTQITSAERLHPGRFRLLLVGDGTQEVCSLGGLPIVPAADLDALTALAGDGSLAALVIPGGNTYATGHDRLITAVEALLAQHVPMAAICGATLLLARSGLLDNRRHTSNAPAYLAATGYSGGELYTESPVVTDGGITTASSVNTVPFTAEIMRLTGLTPVSVADAWERLFLTGELDAFQALTEATNVWASD